MKEAATALLIGCALLFRMLQNTVDLLSFAMEETRTRDNSFAFTTVKEGAGVMQFIAHFVSAFVGMNTVIIFT